MILGESGTGKELVAEALHKRSPRAGERFLAVNCAALSPSLRQQANSMVHRCQDDLPLALALPQAVPLLEQAIRWDRIRPHRSRKRREEEGLS